MMRLLFVYPTYREIRNQPSISEVSRNYGIYPPMNLAYVAAVARHAGHEIKVVDANALGLTKNQVLSIAMRFRPDAMLFTITTYLFHQSLDWIKYLKRIEVPCIVGGVHVGLYPRETLSHKEIDYGVLGDAEQTLPELLNAICSGAGFSRVRGIAYRQGGRITATGGARKSNFLKGVFPARDQLPNNRYYEFISQRKNFTAVITSRGCPFRCSYCEQGSKTFFWQRDVDDVVAELRECYRKYNVREVDFFDPVFTLDRKRTINMCQAIEGAGLGIDFAVRTRADCVDKEVLRALRDAGCKRIYYGIESSDEVVLARMKKSISMQKVKDAINETKKLGMSTFGYFMLGNDGETKESIQKTVDFSLALDLDYVQYNKATALAGTQMYSELMEQIGYDFWSRYSLHKQEPGWLLPKLGTELSDDTVEKHIRHAYKRFYFRPSYIGKRLIGIKSLGELSRYARAAFSFV